MLYQIQKPDSSIKSYLFGTMHASNGYAFTFFTEAVEYLGKCNVFVAEIDFGDFRIQGIGNLFLLPNGNTLLDYIPEKKYDKIKKQLNKSFGINLDLYNRMQPMFSINDFLSDLLPKEHVQPLDHALYHTALEKGLVIDGLETIENQYEIVSKLDLEYQLIQLKALARNPSKARKNAITLMSYYANGDIKTLFHLGRRSLGKYRHILLTDRNKVMSEKLHKLIESKSVFAAVGAGHLYGENGMLKFMKNKGCLVKKVV